MRTFRVEHDYGLGLSVTYVTALDETDCRARCAPFTRVISVE